MRGTFCFPISPNLINQQERQRLTDLLQTGHGHTSASAFVVYQAIHLKPPKLDEVFAHLPDILDHAAQAGPIIPEVAFSIGKTNELRTPETAPSPTDTPPDRAIGILPENGPHVKTAVKTTVRKRPITATPPA